MFLERFGTNDQHVTFGVADELGGNAADEGVLDVRQSSYTADDQVGVVRIDKRFQKRFG